MAISLIPSANQENAGYYAGLLASSFMMGRALTAYHWGKAADIYGRKTVLFASLLNSIIFSIWFGLSTSFPLALLWRFLLYV
jgi:MFS family permease